MEVLVNVAGLAMDPLTKMPVILLLDEKGTRHLLIWIGVLEAVSIAEVMEGVKPPRPLAHDLAKSMLDDLGAKITKTTISEVKDGTYYAVVELTDKDGKIFHKDSRPSDAIGLALRFGCPIYAEEKLLSNVGKSLTVVEQPAGAESEETDLSKMNP